MRTSLDHLVPGALVLTLSMALLPTALSAQDAEQAQEAAAQPEVTQCIATAAPAEVAAGQAAVRLTASLSEDLGTIAGLEGPEGSGLRLADAADIPRAELAAEEEVQLIEMTPETNTVSFWLSTAEASAGEYQAQLTSDQGSCALALTVTEGM
jgi:hypothetical protein